MNHECWFAKNTEPLVGKRVAITGATGGIGEQLCRHLALLGAELILLNRSQPKTEALIETLQREFPTVKATFVPLDLEDKVSVDGAVKRLQSLSPHILIHNAGAYSIPRHKTSQGVDNVFQINCLAPYQMTTALWDTLRNVGGRVVVVGSIAHNYSKTDERDIDFSSRSAASKVYGNAKRRLMLAEYERFSHSNGVSLSVVHPGITFTNITAHYPKWLFAVIKHPMKVIFMPPKKAALCILKGVFDDCGYGEWIGPRLFNVWGLPRKRQLHTFKKEEAERVFRTMEKLTKSRV